MVKSDETTVYYKLVQMHARSPSIADQLHKIAEIPKQCAIDLAAHEQCAVDGRPQPDTELGKLLKSDLVLRTLFTEPPLLSGIQPQVLAIFSAFADAHPNRRGVTVTKDGPFTYIAGRVADEAGTTNISAFQLTFVRRLMDLDDEIPDLMKALRVLSEKENYRDLLIGMDEWFDKVAVATELADLPPSELKPLASVCGPALRGESGSDSLYEFPRISQIPVEFIRSFPERNELSEALDTDPTVPPMMENVHDVMKKAREVRIILARMTADSGEELELAVRLRFDAAQDMLARRKFVKTQVLEFAWPKLLDHVRAPGGEQRLRDLEQAILDPDHKTTLPQAWRDFIDNERFVEFIRVPPYFQDISSGELVDLATPPGQHFKTAHSTIPMGPDEELSFPPYRNFHLVIEPAKKVSSGDKVEAEITFKSEAGDESAKTSISIDIKNVQSRLDALRLAYRQAPLGDQEVGITQRAVVRAEPSAAPGEILEDLGLTLWRTLIPAGGIRDALLEALGVPENVRLVVTCLEPRLAVLPWECLYISALRVFAGLTVKFSIVRDVPDQRSLVARNMTRPIRVLLVASGPVDLPSSSMEQEVAIVKRALEPAERDGAARLEILDHPTEQALRSRLRIFQPHILHYVGHGAISPEGEGLLVLVNDQNRAEPIRATEMGMMLQDHRVLIAVLNGCNTGAALEQDLAQGVAQVLVREGVPVTVATTREVFNHTALRFASEFYRALMDGYPVEGAVVEARKSLGLKGWDWSSYIVHGSLNFPLGDLKLPLQRGTNHGDAES